MRPSMGGESKLLATQQEKALGQSWAVFRPVRKPLGRLAL